MSLQHHGDKGVEFEGDSGGHRFCLSPFVNVVTDNVSRIKKQNDNAAPQNLHAAIVFSP